MVMAGALVVLRARRSAVLTHRVATLEVAHRIVEQIGDVPRRLLLRRSVAVRCRKLSRNRLDLGCQRATLPDRSCRAGRSGRRVVVRGHAPPRRLPASRHAHSDEFAIERSCGDDASLLRAGMSLAETRRNASCRQCHVDPSRWRRSTTRFDSDPYGRRSSARSRRCRPNHACRSSLEASAQAPAMHSLQSLGMKATSPGRARQVLGLAMTALGNGNLRTSMTGLQWRPCSCTFIDRSTICR